MTRAIVLASAAAALALAAPAAAECLDRVAELEQRLGEIEPSAGETEDVQVQTDSGEVTVPADEDGAEPEESWHGDSAAPETAAERLEEARSLAEQGDEDGCAQLVDQAARMIDELEG